VLKGQQSSWVKDNKKIQYDFHLIQVKSRFEKSKNSSTLKTNPRIEIKLRINEAENRIA
jgi:hypothetical protein